MVRCFSDPEVIHVDGSVDPVRDLRVIHNELVQKDLNNVNDSMAGLAKAVARGGGAGPDHKEKKAEHVRDGVTWGGGVTS